MRQSKHLLLVLFLALIPALVSGCNWCDVFGGIPVGEGVPVPVGIVGTVTSPSTGTQTNTQEVDCIPSFGSGLGQPEEPPSGFWVKTTVHAFSNGIPIMPVAPGVSYEAHMITPAANAYGYTFDHFGTTGGTPEFFPPFLDPFIGEDFVDGGVVPARWKINWINGSESWPVKMTGSVDECLIQANTTTDTWVSAGQTVEVPCNSHGDVIKGAANNIPIILAAENQSSNAFTDVTINASPEIPLDPTGGLDVYDKNGDYFTSFPWAYIAPDGSYGVIGAASFQVLPLGENTFIAVASDGTAQGIFHVNITANGSIYRYVGPMNPWYHTTGDHMYSDASTATGYYYSWYTREGIAFRLEPIDIQDPGENWVPFFALYNWDSGENFYTAGADEATALLAQGGQGWGWHWNKDIPFTGETSYIGYIDLQNDPGTVPLFRASKSDGTHFWTTSWDELVNGYHGVYEGIAGYVYP